MSKSICKTKSYFNPHLLQHYMKIILLAPPGGGKGTVSERLVKDFGFYHISMGELLREEIKKETVVGKKIKEIVDKGNLVPDHFIIEMVRLVVKGRDHYILDGFPRTLHQAKEVKDLCIDKVIYLEITENTAVERISGRRVCEKGDHIYHVKFIKPKQAGSCDIDGTTLIQRKDDRESVVKNRFRVYQESTQPLIDFYTREGILIQINGSNSPEVVYQEVKKVVKKS